MVFLLRHGKSSWSDATLRYFDRPLAPRGECAARRVARHMRRQKIRPALVLCSSSLRTRQTLEALAPALGKRSSIELVPEPYAASAEELLERLRGLPDTVGSAMIIGHNPPEPRSGIRVSRVRAPEARAEVPDRRPRHLQCSNRAVEHARGWRRRTGRLRAPQRARPIEPSAPAHSAPVDLRGSWIRTVTHPDQEGCEAAEVQVRLADPFRWRACAGLG